MAVTSRGIVTPNQTDEYNLVTDLNSMATSIDEALKDAANTYRGTSTQRTQFTSQAPEGTIWVDTNGEKKVWKKEGISWIVVGPPTPHVDTGWLPVAPASGFTPSGSPGVRQIGSVLYFRGGLQGTISAQATTTLGTSPLSPGAVSATGGGSSGGQNVDFLRIGTAGIIQVRNAVALTTTFYLFGLSGALVD